MNGGALWTASDASRATGGANTAEWSATGVSIDTRSLTPGDLFIALQGPTFDGHNFIAKAVQAGAAAVVSHRRPGKPGLDLLPGNAALLLVDDTMAALRDLGAAARARSGARFIGVTGSVGKTSTKEALARCLAAQASTAANAASLNNHWGLPLSLARMGLNSVYGVFELGMNHPGEIRDLTALLRPDIALITNVEPAHLGYFASVEKVAEAKAEIFEGVPPDGTAVLNRDNPHFDGLAEKAGADGIKRIIGFGNDARAEVRLVDHTLEETGSKVCAEVLGARLDYRVGLPGTHWVMNSLAILAAVAAAGADVQAAAEELARIPPVKGRGERHHVTLADGELTLIDDSYNANPTSMRAGFEVLGGTSVEGHGRRIAVLGDMLELGKASAEKHAGLAEPLQAAGIDLVFTCGPDMAELNAALPVALRGGHAPDSQALIPLVTASVGAGDALLVKGSAGSRMGLVVEALRGMAGELPRAANGE